MIMHFTHDCSSLKIIRIPSLVSSIGKYTFGSCISFEFIYFCGETSPTVSPNAFLAHQGNLLSQMEHTKAIHLAICMLPNDECYPPQAATIERFFLARSATEGADPYQDELELKTHEFN